MRRIYSIIIVTFIVIQLNAQNRQHVIDSANVAFTTIVNDDKLTAAENGALKCTIDTLLARCSALGGLNSQFVIIPSFSEITYYTELNPTTKEPTMTLKATLELCTKDRRNNLQLLIKHFYIDIAIKGGETQVPYTVVIDFISPEDKRLQDFIHWSQKFTEAFCPKVFNQ